MVVGGWIVWTGSQAKRNGMEPDAAERVEEVVK